MLSTNNQTNPNMQDPALTPAEKSEFPPGTFDKFITVNAYINMRCQECKHEMKVTQLIKLNQTRHGIGNIMPQNCSVCEETNRNKANPVNRMLTITSIDLKLQNIGEELNLENKQ